MINHKKMNFSYFPKWDLLEFLSSYPEIPIQGKNLIEQATHLFNQLRLTPDQVFPEFVVDLYLASLLEPKIPKDIKYTVQQLLSLSDSGITNLAFSLGLPVSASRIRVFRLLTYLDLIQE